MPKNPILIPNAAEPSPFDKKEKKSLDIYSVPLKLDVDLGDTWDGIINQKLAETAKQVKPTPPSHVQDEDVDPFAETSISQSLTMAEVKAKFGPKVATEIVKTMKQKFPLLMIKPTTVMTQTATDEQIKATAEKQIKDAADALKALKASIPIKVDHEKKTAEWDGEKLLAKPTTDCDCAKCKKQYEMDCQAYELQQIQIKEINDKMNAIAQKKAALKQMEELQNKIPVKGFTSSTASAKMVLPKKNSWATLKGTPAGTDGKWGGVSPYDDDDVIAATEYMQECLGIESMEINGRSLAHILAEVRGFAEREYKNASSELNSAKWQLSQVKQNVTNKEDVIKNLNNHRNQLKKELAQVKSELTAEISKPKWQEIKGDHTPTDTTRRIKDE